MTKLCRVPNPHARCMHKALPARIGGDGQAEMQSQRANPHPAKSRRAAGEPAARSCVSSAA